MAPWVATERLRRERSGLGQKIGINRLLQRRAIKIWPSVFIAGGPADLIYDIPGIARAQFLMQSIANEIDKFPGHVWVECKLLLTGNTAEYFAELFV
jgi:hypothetical protein